METLRNIFDTHAHYSDEAFNGDRDEFLSELPKHGICNVINCGDDLKSSDFSVKLAAKYPYIYAAIGIHPECANDIPQNYIKQLEALITKEKVVAVGEIGLDYHFKDRDAHGDTMDILRKYKPKGVVHCFSGSVEMARECIKLGMYIGIGGAVTFKNARVPVEVAKDIPLERMLMETDCPYMSPVPFRGKRNNSKLIAYSAAKIAEIRGTTIKEILETSRKNAETLFNINN